jgi:hypothetical protein
MAKPQRFILEFQRKYQSADVILEFQRKYQSTDALDIVNINVQ